jgi:hypothetical protein
MELSFGDCSPCKTNKNTPNSTNNTKHIKYKYTCYQNTHKIVKNTHKRKKN